MKRCNKCRFKEARYNEHTRDYYAVCVALGYSIPIREAREGIGEGESSYCGIYLSRWFQPIPPKKGKK